MPEVQWSSTIRFFDIFVLNYCMNEDDCQNDESDIKRIKTDRKVLQEVGISALLEPINEP